MTRAEFIKLVEAKIQDQKPEINLYETSRGLTSANLISELIDGSISELSDYTPQVKIGDFTGTGSRYYGLIATLTDWTAVNDENAEVSRVWLDISDSTSADRDFEELAVKYWTVDYWIIAGTQVKALIFRGAFLPSSSNTVRVEYFIDHTFPDAGEASLEAKHLDAFSDLIAGKYLLKALASNMVQDVSSTPVADALSPLDPVLTVQRAARTLMNLFYEHFGEDPNATRDSRSQSRKQGANKLRQWRKASNKTSRHWLYARGG
jgi:hypothetical protein